MRAPAGGLVVTGDDGVPTVNGVPLGEQAQRMMSGDMPAERGTVVPADDEGGQQVDLRAPLNTVTEWLAGQQETREFRQRVGVAPGQMTPMQRHMAQAQAAEAAEARAEAQRRQQAEATRLEQLQEMASDAGQQEARYREVQRMVAERREQQAAEAERSERIERAQDYRATLYAAGHRPKTVAEVLAAQAMFA